ncbi:hypothetical protein [Neobacillus rhizosphaerae]|nr:hypothetical protein [Neobacillus rhizosphaerae]
MKIIVVSYGGEQMDFAEVDHYFDDFFDKLRRLLRDQEKLRIKAL